MKTVPTSPLLHPATGTDYRRPLYVSKTGRKFWPIGGAAPEDETPEEKTAREEAERKKAEEEAAKTFTQEEMNRIATREKRDGKNSGQLELAKELGFETVEEMKSAAQAQKEAAEKAKTDEQKRLDAVAKREKEAEDREAKAAARERLVTLKDALRDAGANKDDLDDLLVLLTTKVKDDDDEDAIEEAVKSLKERRADMFDAAEVKPAPRGRQPLPTKPTKTKVPEGAVYGARGLERARRDGHIKDDA